MTTREHNFRASVGMREPLCARESALFALSPDSSFASRELHRFKCKKLHPKVCRRCKSSHQFFLLKERKRARERERADMI